MSKILVSVGQLTRVNWQHRRLATTLIRRDFKVRYLGSLLGRYWNIVHPLAMIAIYTIVFSRMMKARLGELAGPQGQHPLAYTIYLCAGVLPWNSFVESVSRGTRVFLDHSHLIKKVTFPVEILPIVSSGVASSSYAFAMLVYFALAIGLGPGFGWPLLALPIFVLLQFMFATGLGMFLSVLNVYFRDAEQMVSIVFQLWFWLTPIVYLEVVVPEALQFFFRLNPFYWFVRAYHDILFFNRWPNATTYEACCVVGIITFLIGAAVFMQLKDGVVDEV